MSILDLDTPPWLVITRHLAVDDIQNIANTCERLRNHVRKLASMIMQRYPHVYSASDPFPRLMRIHLYTCYKARLRYIPPEEETLECLNIYRGYVTKYNVPYRDEDLGDGSEWLSEFSIDGLPVPKGTVVYLLIYAPTERRPTRTRMFLNVDQAIDHYIADRYHANCRIIIDLYLDETYDIDHDDATSNVNNPQVQEWMRDSGAPIVPYTEDNIRAYMRKHLRAWLLDFNENEYVQIIPAIA
jgi:hypothetical protein